MTVYDVATIQVVDETSTTGEKINIFKDLIARMRVSDMRLMAICGIIPNVETQDVRKMSRAHTGELSLTSTVVSTIPHRVRTIAEAIEVLNGEEIVHPLFPNEFKWGKIDSIHVK